MKDLKAAKKILGMEIFGDRQTNKFYLSEKGYIEKVLHKLNMLNAKLVSTPLATHFRLSFALSPHSEDDVDYMSRVSYLSVVRSIVYAMICPHPDLSYVVSVVSKYMTNLVKNIGRQFSGYSGTFMILLMFVCILGGKI